MMDTDADISNKRKIHIRLAASRVNPSVALMSHNRQPKIYTPGQIITEQSEFLRLVVYILFKIIYRFVVTIN